MSAKTLRSSPLVLLAAVGGLTLVLARRDECTQGKLAGVNGMDLFNNLDANQDGVLSFDDFKHLDTDDNGAVSSTEFLEMLSSQGNAAEKQEHSMVDGDESSGALAETDSVEETEGQKTLSCVVGLADGQYKSQMDRVINPEERKLLAKCSHKASCVGGARTCSVSTSHCVVEIRYTKDPFGPITWAGSWDSSCKDWTDAKDFDACETMMSKSTYAALIAKKPALKI